MKAADIKIGGEYKAKVSDRVVTVRVLAVLDQTTFGGRAVKTWRCVNLTTGREIVVKSAQRFRERVNKPPVAAATPEKSKGHIEFIGGFEYYTVATGDLYRAPISNPVMPDGYRSGRFECYTGTKESALAIARAAVANTAETPFAKMIREARSTNPDCICLFHVGDFYEMFYDDATNVARILGLTLSARDKGPNPIPMAGFPHHQLDAYVGKLVASGHRVAICEQVK